MGNTACCFHPGSKYQGALAFLEEGSACSWWVLVLSRRQGGQAQGPSWRRAGWQTRGGRGAGDPWQRLGLRVSEAEGQLQVAHGQMRKCRQRQY